MRGINILTRRLKNVIYNQILIGQVIRAEENEKFKIVKVMQMELSKKFHMYFNKSREFKCRDTNLISKTGDLVMLKRISPKEKPFDDYEVGEIVFKGSETVDPFTKEIINNSTLNPI